MLNMFDAAGFRDVEIEVKENAADIIKGWMPGSGAEKYVTSAYVTAVKPLLKSNMKDDVRRVSNRNDAATPTPMAVDASGAPPADAVGC